MVLNSIGMDGLDGGFDRTYSMPVDPYYFTDNSVMYDPGMSDTGYGLGSSGPEYSDGPSLTDGIYNAIGTIVSAGANAAAGAINPNGYNQPGLYPNALQQQQQAAQQRSSLTTLVVIGAAAYFLFLRKR